MDSTQIDETAKATVPQWGAPLAVGLTALGACGVAAVINPYRGEGIPCPFHLVTGLWCPVCGSTRALHSVLAGNLSAAFARNPLFVVLLPIALWTWAGWLSESMGGPRLWRIPQRRWVAVTFGLVVVAFWVARNLPVPALRTLGP